tara:strand:- start:1943 stop:4810 length:2868 start_codon:yes stop_codon:yes gene_type:complete
MSIFKESFKGFVKDQIKQRQEKVSKADRTYFLQRQCTIRLSSAVNTENEEGQFNSDLAKNNVLQGGILTPGSVNPTQTVPKSGEKEFAFTARGGFDNAYDSPSDGYGHIPMPGITSVNIKTKTAYGSLRGATINFECHNLKQLSVLEKLYMRPGYPCLLEWGWVPYINNKDEQGNSTVENTMHFLSDDGQFFSFPNTGAKEGEPVWHILNSGETQQDALSRKIKSKKETYSGNYDGLFGIVKNFNYSVRPDGGFTCMTELVALGEVLDSLKGTNSQDNPSKHNLEDLLIQLNDYAQLSIEGDITEAENIDEGNLDTNQVNNSSVSYQTEYDGVETPNSGDISTFSADSDQGDRSNQRDFRDTRFEKRKKAFNLLKNKLESLNIVLNRDIVFYNENSKYDKNGADIYMRWGSFIKLINDSIDKDDDGNPLIEFTVLGDDGLSLLYNENKIPSKLSKLLLKPFGDDIQHFPTTLDISTNPQICLFPSQIFDILGDDHITLNKIKVSSLNPFGDSDEDTPLTGTGTYNANEFTGGTFESPNINLSSQSTKLKEAPSERRISNIFFNIAYLYKIFKSLYYNTDSNGKEYEDETFSIGKYVKTMWDDVNLACGNGHNFQTITDFNDGRLCKIIDLEIKNPPTKDLAELNALSTNSIIREFNYDLTVPSSLTSTIAIAAQNPDNPGDLNQVTFGAFNKGIRNRFITNNKKNKKSSSRKKLKYYKCRQTIGSPQGEITVTGEKALLRNNGDSNQTSFQDDIRTLNDLLIETQIYLDRLKGYNVQYYDDRLKSLLELDKVKSQIIETPLVAKTKAFNAKQEQAYRNPIFWGTAGDSFVDFGEIPGTTISTMRNALKKIITLKNDLLKYNLDNITVEDLFLTIPNQSINISNPDVTSIIPIKFNMKLDGISGIVIGNVFKLIKSRLPESYHNSNVAFVVFGEEQTIEGQDWTTTITGQVILLPI